jgi:ABC-2 type transport system ATP-binding protein
LRASKTAWIICSTSSSSENTRDQTSAGCRGGILRSWPKVLLLDEPLNYLDIPTQEKVITMLDKLEGTHLVSTHIMSIAGRLTDSVVMISKGAILWEGTIEQLRKKGSSDEPIEKIVARMMSGAF